MKPTEKDVENELRSLVPRAPSPGLRQGIARSLKTRPLKETVKPVSLWKPLSLGLAASLALAMVFLFSNHSRIAPNRSDSHLSETHKPADLSAYLPIQAEQRLIKAVDEGVVRNDANEPVRKFRYQFVDSVTLKNQENGSVFTMEVPRDEIILVPLSLI